MIVVKWLWGLTSPERLSSCQTSLFPQSLRYWWLRNTAEEKKKSYLVFEVKWIKATWLWEALKGWCSRWKGLQISSFLIWFQPWCHPAGLLLAGANEQRGGAGGEKSLSPFLHCQTVTLCSVKTGKSCDRADTLRPLRHRPHTPSHPLTHTHS